MEDEGWWRKTTPVTGLTRHTVNSYYETELIETYRVSSHDQVLGITRESQTTFLLPTFHFDTRKIRLVVDYPQMKEIESLSGCG